MSARLSARLLALGLLLTLLAGRPAGAAGMPPEGTKNFMPGPQTPSYFTGEWGTPDAGPGGFPAQPVIPAAIQSSNPAAMERPGGDLYARPAVPAREAAAHPRWIRPVYARSWHGRGRAESVRTLRPHRLRTLRLAHLHQRHRTVWRR